MRKTLKFNLIVILFVFFISNCGDNAMEKDLRTFIEEHVTEVKPMMTDMNLAYWDAAISGKKEDYDNVAKLELKLRMIYSDTADFAKIMKFKKSGEIEDELLSRQLEILYSSYLGNQIQPDLLKKMVESGSKIENKFAIFRGVMNGKKVTDNEIKQILGEETDSSIRKAAWRASKQVGEEVAEDIIELVKMRNEAARDLGFDNYYLMSLALSEQSIEELNTIFDELANLTDQPFAELKSELDSLLAEKYGVAKEGLMPWHYHDPFFQEGPQVYEIDLDKYFEQNDIKLLARTFYNGIGLNVDAILKNSDLYEKDGKNQHAFCTDIDRKGDVRILCNLKNNEKWMDTILHELGHAVYDKYMSTELPFLLREPAHTFTTEAIAQFFGRLSHNAYWIQEMVHITDAERDRINDIVFKSLKLQQLIFARWCQVMVRFEQELYKNPDQDLNSLWWKLVEKYQMVKKPAGRNKADWAAKIHFTIAPVYYHNYMLGELLASQLHVYIVNSVLHKDSDVGVSYVGQKQVGRYLQNNIFDVGARYKWNEMITNATGEGLTAKYFVQQFIH